jgi:hypothetical protein
MRRVWVDLPDTKPRRMKIVGARPNASFYGMKGEKVMIIYTPHQKVRRLFSSMSRFIYDDWQVKKAHGRFHDLRRVLNV